MRDEHNHQMQSWLHMETWRMHAKRVQRPVKMHWHRTNALRVCEITQSEGKFRRGILSLTSAEDSPRSGKLSQKQWTNLTLSTPSEISHIPLRQPDNNERI
jgi:hypothetical protein